MNSPSSNNNKSVESIGLDHGNLKQVHDSSLPKLIPEGAETVNEELYDCIVYVIYCPEHDQVAITNVDRVKCTWLPFVVLPEGVSWEKAANDGVTALIGRQDAEMDADEAERTAPVFFITYMHIMRTQISSSRIVLRLTMIVTLQRNEYFQCCENSTRVNWVSCIDVLNDQLGRVWGPELKMMTSMLLSRNSYIINEFTLQNAMYYLHLSHSSEQSTLRANNVNEQNMQMLFGDYLEHCYPSLYMCLESFKTYLIKYNFTWPEQQIYKLFVAFASQKRYFIDFHELVMGINIMEPTCKNNQECRLKFIFR